MKFENDRAPVSDPPDALKKSPAPVTLECFARIGGSDQNVFVFGKVVEAKLSAIVEVRQTRNDDAAWSDSPLDEEFPIPFGSDAELLKGAGLPRRRRACEPAGEPEASDEVIGEVFRVGHSLLNEDYPAPSNISLDDQIGTSDDEVVVVRLAARVQRDSVTGEKSIRIPPELSSENGEVEPARPAGEVEKAVAVVRGVVTVVLAQTPSHLEHDGCLIRRATDEKDSRACGQTRGGGHGLYGTAAELRFCEIGGEEARK